MYLFILPFEQQVPLYLREGRQQSSRHQNNLDGQTALQVKGKYVVLILGWTVPLNVLHQTYLSLCQIRVYPSFEERNSNQATDFNLWYKVKSSMFMKVFKSCSDCKKMIVG